MAIQLINQDTGAIDDHCVKERAMLRACREFGGPNPPLCYVNEAYEWCRERAIAERLQWRQHRGLRDESPCTLVDTAGWTDTFRRMA